MTNTQSTDQLQLKNHYQTSVAAELKKEFKIKNTMAVPRLKKIVLNIGVTDPLEIGPREAAIKNIVEQFRVITGQQPQVTKSKKSIASFKSRAGDPVGVMVTLRSRYMWEFLEKLIRISLPRVKDFRGVSRVGFDAQGNYSLGLEEQIVFPEIEYDKIERIRSLQINIVTSAENKEQAFRLLELLGMPFMKEDK